MKFFRIACFLSMLVWSTSVFAGSIFVTGHDPVWHSHFGGNRPGANNLALTAISFARNGSPLPFLFVESINVSVPSGNAHEAPFLISDLGFSASDFVVADINVLNGFSNFRAALNNFSAIVVASDHGGMLSAAELQFLNAHANDIIDYINAGGGLAASAESNARGMIGSTPRFAFLPFLVASTDFGDPESGNTVTAFGVSLGLSNFDVNGNFSHNFFAETGGMTPVDLRNGNPNEVLSLAFRGRVGPGGVAIEVALDIKPQSCPNPVNPGSGGYIPISILGTADFDPMDIDLTTVQLSRADGVGGFVVPNEGPPGPHSVFEDTATPFDGELCDCHALEGDGFDDLSMKFKTQDVVVALELDVEIEGTVLELVVSGNLLDGTPFVGSDCIVIVGGGGGNGNGNGS